MKTTGSTRSSAVCLVLACIFLPLAILQSGCGVDLVVSTFATAGEAVQTVKRIADKSNKVGNAENPIVVDVTKLEQSMTLKEPIRQVRVARPQIQGNVTMAQLDAVAEQIRTALVRSGVGVPMFSTTVAYTVTASTDSAVPAHTLYLKGEAKKPEQNGSHNYLLSGITKVEIEDNKGGQLAVTYKVVTTYPKSTDPRQVSAATIEKLVAHVLTVCGPILCPVTSPQKIASSP